MTYLLTGSFRFSIWPVAFGLIKAFVRCCFCVLQAPVFLLTTDGGS
jgi:hypothetical protein